MKLELYTCYFEVEIINNGFLVTLRRQYVDSRHVEKVFKETREEASEWMLRKMKEHLEN